MERTSNLLVGLLVAVVASASTFTDAALAQDEPPSDDEINAVAKGLYCPVCENVPLDVCPTQACKQWRDTIGEKLAQGWSQDHIEQYFVNQYGDRVLAIPPATGLNWLVYLLPPLVFVAGAVILGGAIRSWRISPQPNGQTADEPSADPYLERVEEELRRRG